MTKDYITWIRSKVGHDTIFLNYVGGVIYDREGRILLQRRADKNKWGFPELVNQQHMDAFADI